MRLTIKNLTNLLLFSVFLFFWWFTASAINPQLHYYLQQSAFLTDLSFFKNFLRYPGGIADYISEFIAQFFYFKILGSFLITLTALLMGIMAIQLIQRIAGKIKLNFSVVAVFVFLSTVIQCNYYYPYYASIRILITIAFILIFSVLTSKFSQWRYPLSFLLGIVLFYMAGGAALFTYAFSVILLQIHFNSKKTDWIRLPLFALFAAILPYVSYKYIFLISLPLVYDLTHSKSPEILYYAPDFKLYAFYSLLPVYILIAIIYNRQKLKSASRPAIVKPKKVVPAKKGVKKQESGPVLKQEMMKKQKGESPLVWVAGQVIVIAILAGLSLQFSLDKTTRNKVQVSYYASNSDWEMVLKSAKNVDGYDIFTNVEYNRALANMGTLAENLFSYAQLAGPSGLFVDEKVTSDIPFICSDQYYDLGFMHESQHWAFEAQTIFPNSPRLLKRLVLINLVNGQYDLAKRYLHQLKDNMLYGDWVDRYQKYIEDTTLVGKDEQLSWKRKCEPLENFTASNAYLKLTKLLEANPGNRLASDYLLCSVLLDGDLATFKNLLDKSSHLIRSPLPRVYDEALVLYYYMTRKAPVPGEIRYSAERQKQFIAFTKAIKPYKNNWQSARQSLAGEFGNTYWYYLKCLSPKVTKAQIKRQ